jgi:hypothetical protein
LLHKLRLDSSHSVLQCIKLVLPFGSTGSAVYWRGEYGNQHVPVEWSTANSVPAQCTANSACWWSSGVRRTAYLRDALRVGRVRVLILVLVIRTLQRLVREQGVRRAALVVGYQLHLHTEAHAAAAVDRVVVSGKTEAAVIELLSLLLLILLL